MTAKAETNLLRNQQILPPTASKTMGTPTASLKNVSRSENIFLVEEERQEREGLVNLGDRQQKLE